MLRSFMSRFRSQTAGEGVAARPYKRAYKRHDTDRCMATIRGQTFRVRNWCFGGIGLAAEDGIFRDGQPVAMTLNFKLRKSDLEIVHHGVVIRNDNRSTTIRFDPLKHHVTRGLQRVVDDDYARGQSNPAR